MKHKLSLMGNTALVSILALGVGALVGTAVAYLPKKSYTASITVYVAPPTSSSPTDAVMGDQYATNRAQLYQSLVTSEPLLETVADALEPRPSPDSLAERVTASSINQTSLIRIDTTGSTPEAAAALARAYGLVFPDFAKSVEAQSGIREGPTVNAVSALDKITATRVGMSPAVTITAFAVVCAVLGWLASAWYNRRNPLVRNPRQLRKHISSGFIESVRVDRASGDFQRVQALLLSARREAPLLFVAPDIADSCAGFVGELVDSAVARDIPVRSVPLVDIEDDVPDESRSTLFVAPSILDDSRQAALLGLQPFDVVVVCRKSITPVRSILEAIKMLEMSGAPVKGVVIVQPRSWNSARGRTVEDGAGDGPLIDAPGAEELAGRPG